MSRYSYHGNDDNDDNDDSDDNDDDSIYLMAQFFCGPHSTKSSTDSCLPSVPPNSTANRLVGLVVKAYASRVEDPGFESCHAPGFFRGRVKPVTSKLALQWLPCQAPGVIGSVLALAGPVSVYCDWVRRKRLVCNFYLSVAACKIV